jgi:hypothetical protein
VVKPLDGLVEEADLMGLLAERRQLADETSGRGDGSRRGWTNCSSWSLRGSLDPMVSRALSLDALEELAGRGRHVAGTLVVVP